MFTQLTQSGFVVWYPRHSCRQGLELNTLKAWRYISSPNMLSKSSSKLPDTQNGWKEHGVLGFHTAVGVCMAGREDQGKCPPNLT